MQGLQRAAHHHHNLPPSGQCDGGEAALPDEGYPTCQGRRCHLGGSSALVHAEHQSLLQESKEESGTSACEADLGHVLSVPGQLLPTTGPPVPPEVILAAKRTYAEAAATPEGESFKTKR